MSCNIILTTHPFNTIFFDKLWCMRNILKWINPFHVYFSIVSCIIHSRFHSSSSLTYYICGIICDPPDHLSIESINRFCIAYAMIVNISSAGTLQSLIWMATVLTLIMVNTSTSTQSLHWKYRVISLFLWHRVSHIFFSQFLQILIFLSVFANPYETLVHLTFLWGTSFSVLGIHSCIPWYSQHNYNYPDLWCTCNKIRCVPLLSLRLYCLSFTTLSYFFFILIGFWGYGLNPGQVHPDPIFTSLLLELILN